MTSPSRSVLIRLMTLVTLGVLSLAFAQNDRVINLRVEQDMSNLDPAHVIRVTDHAISLMIHGSLYRYEVGGLGVVPELATGHDLSSDGLVYTFYLRDDVQWQYGYGPFTAHDVVFSINRLKDPATASRLIGDVEMIADITALDDHTVQITLVEPFSPFLTAILAFRPGWIVNEQAVTDRGDTYGVDPVGTGPYQFDSWLRGTEITLVRNPDYYGETEADRLVFKVINDDAVAELALRAGEIDISYIYDGEVGQRLIDLADRSPDFDYVNEPGELNRWMSFNLDRPNVQDIRVRQAIIHAIDLHTAVEVIFGDLSTPTTSLFSKSIPSFLDIEPYPYDPDRARELLAEAGYADGITLDLLIQPSRRTPELSTVLQEMWRQVGINVNLIVRERAVYDQLLLGDDYDMIAKNINRANAYQFAVYAYGPSGVALNSSRYSGADDIFDAAVREVDADAADELWREFQRQMIAVDVAGFGLANANALLVWRSHLDNVDTMYQDSWYVPDITFR